MPTPDYFIVPTAEISRELCRIVVEEIVTAVSLRGICHVALPGGSVAQLLFPLLCKASVPWSQVQLFWSDERAVPATHEDSNFRLADQLLLKHIHMPLENVHAMTGDPVFLSRDAEDHEREIREVLGEAGRFDLILMGVGADAHICSLFPDHALLDESVDWVGAVVDSPKPPPHRLTLTLPVLTNARRVLVGATGPSKAQAVADAAHDWCETPLARMVRGAESLAFVLDEDAASKL